MMDGIMEVFCWVRVGAETHERHYTTRSFYRAINLLHVFIETEYVTVYCKLCTQQKNNSLKNTYQAISIFSIIMHWNEWGENT